MCSCITVLQGSVSVTSLAALCPITKAVAYFSGTTSSSSATIPVVTTSTVSSNASSTSECPPSPISAATASCTPDVQSPASTTSATTATATAAAVATTTVKPYNNPGIRPRSMPQAHFTTKSEHDRVPETVLAAVRAKPKLQESQQQQQQQQHQQQQQQSRKSSNGSSSAAAVADSTDKHSSGSSDSLPVVAVIVHERKRLSVSFADTAAADITERVNSHRTSITCSSVSLNSDGAHSSTSTCSISAPNSPTSVIVDSSSSGSIFDMRRRASTDITTGTTLQHTLSMSYIASIKNLCTVRAHLE
jgi:hypothetical protein